jgi:hypothetical protein
VVTTALLAVNVVSDQEAIIKKQNELSADGRQLVALNGLALTLTGLLKAYEDKAFDIAPLAETWTTLASNLETVRDLIIEATRPAVLKEVLRDLEDLKGTFDALTAYATELQNLALAGDSKPIQVFTIPLSERAA